MESLKEKIIALKKQNLTNKEIAEQLNCNSGTVSYHLDPDRSEKLKDRRDSYKDKNPKVKKPHKYIDKQIAIKIVDVNWKYAEMICVAEMVKLGYDVFIPSCGGGEIDFIAHKDSELIRAQIKSITPTDNECISVDLTRNAINYKSHYSTDYKNVDWFLIYDGNNIYKVDTKVYKGKRNITLRYTVPKSGQHRNVNMAKDFIFIAL